MVGRAAVIGHQNRFSQIPFPAEKPDPCVSFRDRGIEVVLIVVTEEKLFPSLSARSNSQVCAKHRKGP
jgi:hypothetical protein